MDCRVISAFTRVFNALCPAMTLYTTPVVYLYLDRVQVWLKGDKARAQREPERLRVVAAE